MNRESSLSSRRERWTRCLRPALGLAVIAWVSCVANEGGLSVSNRPPAVAHTSGGNPKWYALPAQGFRALPEAQRAMDFSKLDQDLLAAAIHHATNLERAKNRLPPLQHEPAASQAAGLQARVMATEKFLGHENNLDAGLKTPLDRIRKVGLRPRFVAENVALEPARKHRSGEDYYTRTEKGVTVFSATPDGPPIPMHSYAGFAEMLLNGWMGSPGHRANILSDKPSHLGCAASSAFDSTGLEMLYCVQVFFTPLPAPNSRPSGDE